MTRELIENVLRPPRPSGEACICRTRKMATSSIPANSLSSPAWTFVAAIAKRAASQVAAARHVSGWRLTVGNWPWSQVGKGWANLQVAMQDSYEYNSYMTDTVV